MDRNPIMEACARSGCGRCLGTAGASGCGRTGRRRSGSARGGDTCDHGRGSGRADDDDIRHSAAECIVDDTGHHGVQRDDARDHHPGASCLSDPRTADHVADEHSHHSTGYHHPDPHRNCPARKHSHHDDDRQSAMHRSVGERIGGGGNGGGVVDHCVRCGVVGARGRWRVCSVAGRFRGSGVHCEQWASLDRRHVQHHTGGPVERASNGERGRQPQRSAAGAGSSSDRPHGRRARGQSRATPAHGECVQAVRRRRRF